MEEDLSRSSLPGWLVGSIVAALLLVLGLAAFYVAAARQRAEAEKAWEDLQPELQRFEQRYPKAAANASALSLEDSAARLGVDVAPGKAETQSRLMDEERGRSDALRQAFRDYVTAEASRAEEGIGAPPEAVRVFLENNAGALRELRDDLLEYDPPRWEQDVRLRLAPMQSLLPGVMRLQRILIAEALVDAKDGRRKDAQRDLDASWRLNGALTARPELVSQLVAIAVAKLQAGVLRQLPVDSGAWRERLSKLDLADGFFNALVSEALVPAVSETDRARRGERARYAMAWRAAVEELRRQSPCAFTQQKARAVWAEHLDEGPGSVAVPNLSNAVYRLFRVLVDSELTLKVLEARTSRFDMTSRVCPEAKWAYRFGASTGTVSFEGKIEDWPDSIPLKLPLSFTFRKP